MNYPDVLEFWFLQLNPTDWFKKDEILDLRMVEKFIAIHAQAVSGELFRWRDDPLGRLAEIILIDQFSRNIYRDDPKAFISDPMALVLSQEAIYGNHHKSFDNNHKIFLYLPFMHSESKSIHQIAVKLFSEPGLEESLAYENEHKKIIDRFGRYPERNKILGRTNTPEEEYYLLNKPAEKRPPPITPAEGQPLH
ncbi:MAG: DUF924 family protein [Bacteriovorax sp.]|jgi:uncharacterized protein (DUF924 family)